MKVINAKVIKITEKKSKHGGRFYYVFFKGEDGRSYRTHLVPQFGNFQRWGSVLADFERGIEIWLKGLIVRKESPKVSYIDADSLFERIENPGK